MSMTATNSCRVNRSLGLKESEKTKEPAAIRFFSFSSFPPMQIMQRGKRWQKETLSRLAHSHQSGNERDRTFGPHIVPRRPLSNGQPAKLERITQQRCGGRSQQKRLRAIESWTKPLILTSPKYFQEWSARRLRLDPKTQSKMH